MEKFKKVYPFTTENIAGYMSDLDLKDKKVLTVTGSGDHALNAILKGAIDITCFDVNPEAKNYTIDKIDLIKYLSYEDFLKYMVFDNLLNGKYSLELKYYNPYSKIKHNLYLTRENYYKLKELLRNVVIKFINTNIIDLKINEQIDYMFLSNISDYLGLLYKDEELEKYHDLMMNFLEYVDYIYMAYLYDIASVRKRSRIDNLDEVNKIFKKYKKLEFASCLEGKEKASDAVLILKGSDYYGK